ncbi:hypothetical protein LMG28138_05995 [Pararobbsia alpina]|uniref:Uncharacterized protein n=1 Tax=Pararobbsia alpina TaxID=621374 RepID=A0A6S7BPB3_9BURK|nr:hypothetical protein LMG28138_05995 [Pararobbsia alpina]
MTLPSAASFTSWVPTTVAPRTVRSRSARIATASPDTVLATPIFACVRCAVSVVERWTKLPRLDSTEVLLSCASRPSSIVTLPLAAIVAAPLPFATSWVAPAVNDEPVSVTLPLPSVRAWSPASGSTAASVALPPAEKRVPTACWSSA